MKYKEEKDMYPIIANYFTSLFTSYGYNVKVYNTYKGFDIELKKVFGNEITLLGNYFSPDLMISLTKNGATDFMVIEVKKDRITIKDIAQTKMYGDILKPKYLLLIGGELPEREWINYHKMNKYFLRYNSNKIVHMCPMTTRGLHASRMIPEVIYYD
ncbi:hypothetical protein ACAG96_04485 [Candidatus Izemoplasma sp. B36]|uniref:hypothetical protein n=1 Tax=Candidatus Izemoplasma sp. B36 TaxID=3242468 RepID=UPI0035569C56